MLLDVHHPSINTHSSCQALTTTRPPQNHLGVNHISPVKQRVLRIHPLHPPWYDIPLYTCTPRSKISPHHKTLPPLQSHTNFQQFDTLEESFPSPQTTGYESAYLDTVRYGLSPLQAVPWNFSSSLPQSLLFNQAAAIPPAGPPPASSQSQLYAYGYPHGTHPPASHVSLPFNTSTHADSLAAQQANGRRRKASDLPEDQNPNRRRREASQSQESTSEFQDTMARGRGRGRGGTNRGRGRGRATVGAALNTAAMQLPTPAQPTPQLLAALDQPGRIFLPLPAHSTSPLTAISLNEPIDHQSRPTSTFSTTSSLGGPSSQPPDSRPPSSASSSLDARSVAPSPVTSSHVLQGMHSVPTCI